AVMVGLAFVAYPPLRMDLQELYELQNGTVGRRLQIGTVGIEQYIAQGHHQTAFGLAGGKTDHLFFQPAAVLLHAEQLGFAQCQLQTLTFKLKLGGALMIEAYIAVLPGDLGVALAEIGVMTHILATAPVARQPLGTSKGFARPNHILGRSAQDVGIFLDRLEAQASLFQRLFACRLMTRATIQKCADQQQPAKITESLHHMAPSCWRRRPIRWLSSVSCSRLLALKC